MLFAVSSSHVYFVAAEEDVNRRRYMWRCMFVQYYYLRYFVKGQRGRRMMWCAVTFLLLVHRIVLFSCTKTIYRFGCSEIMQMQVSSMCILQQDYRQERICDCGTPRIKMMALPTVLLRTVNITRLSVTSFPCRYCFNVIISFCIVTRLLFRLVILLFYERMYLLYHCNSKEKRKSFISAILRTRKCTTSHGQACHGEDKHHVICST